MKKFVSVLLVCGMLCAFLGGCDFFDTGSESSTRRKRSPVVETEKKIETIDLESDAILYESPDGNSAQIGTVTKSDAVEYISTKEVDGVVWYETAEGWFSVFVPTGHSGRVISSGVAKERIRIMSGAANSAAEVGTYEAGSSIEVYQMRGQWAQTAKGWILTDGIYIPGQTGTNSGWCLTLSNVTCYKEPGYNSTSVTQYRALFRLKFYETITINTVLWGYTDNGWVDLTNVYIEGTTGEGACRAQVTDSTPLNVRVGPGTGYDIVRAIPVRSYVDVLFQVTVNGKNWGFVGDGWIYMELTKIQ